MSDSTTESDGKDAHQAKALVRAHFDAINDRNRKAVADLHAEDVVVHSAGREIHGVEAVIEDWWAQLEAMPDLVDTIDMLIAEGGHASVRYTSTGTHEGEFRGIEPTGEPIEITSMAIIRVDEGDIVEWWNHPNRFALFQQLGLIDASNP